MDSRLLTNLNAQAGEARDPVVWARAVCRAASHFAGQGKTNEALKAISIVRAQFGKDLHFDIASWLMLAEGVLHYYKGEFPQAYDRMRRAYALAIALKNVSAFPSCAAWMAHLEYNSGQYDLMAQHLKEAADFAAPTDKQAIARYSMIVAISYHIADQFELSRPWYEKARLNAALEGDNATISATLHNMASVRAANTRLLDVFGRDASSEISRVKLEFGSSNTYDRVIGLCGLTFLSQMLSGLIFTLDRRHEQALQEFNCIDIDAVPTRFASVVLVDCAWCHLQLGNHAQAATATLETLRRISDVTEHDDLAYIHARLSQILRSQGDTSQSDFHKRHAEDELQKHRIFE